MKKSNFLLAALVVVAGVVGYFLFNPSVWRTLNQEASSGGGDLLPSPEVVAADSDPSNRPQFQYQIKSKTRSPQYLALAGDKLYVSYAGLNMIDLLDYQGGRVQMFDPLPQGRIDIVGLGIDNAGQLYVAGGKRKMVLVFDQDQKFLYTFPPQGGKLSPVSAGLSLAGLTIERGMMFTHDREDRAVHVFWQLVIMFTQFAGMPAKKRLAHGNRVMLFLPMMVGL